MLTVFAVFGIVIGLFLSALFSGAETGLYCIDRLRLHLGVQRREPAALRVAHLLDDEPGALSVTLVGTNLANYLTTVSLAALLAEGYGFPPYQAEIYTVAILAPAVFVIGEVVPKSLFQRHANVLMPTFSRLLAFSNRLCRLLGIVASFKLLSRLLERAVNLPPTAESTFAPKRRIAFMLREALASHVQSQEQSELVDRICRLSETQIHAVMVPRNKVRVVSAQTDRKKLLRISRRTGHARLPVFDSAPTRIIGVISVDALLRDQEWTTVADRMKPPLTLSPHESVAVAVVRLQREGQQLAVVTDRGGQMLGIVVLKDLLGQVVGGWISDD